MRRLPALLLFFGLGLLVFFITREAYRPEDREASVFSTVLLQRVRPVLKLITVEGEFSEVYTFRDADAQFDWMKQLTPFQKKVILRVQARVSVGYDLDGLGISVDEASRTITLNAPPEPSILSTEHDVEYYDLEEGVFNEFTATDLTRINAEAKARIIAKVPESGLYDEARKQRDTVVEAVRVLVEDAGWKLELGWMPRDARKRLKG